MVLCARNCFAMVNSSSLPSASQYFPNAIAEKLDDSNYHVELVIKSHRLDWFVVNPVIPPHFLSKE